LRFWPAPLGPERPAEYSSGPPWARSARRRNARSSTAQIVRLRQRTVIGPEAARHIRLLVA